MKRLSLFLAFLLFSTVANAQVSIRTVEKQELSATVFIFAEADEFKSGIYEPYYSDIQSYFENYKDHELFDFIEDVLRPAGIGYNAVPIAAQYFDIKNGRIKLAKNYKDIANFDDRWSVENFKRYTMLLNDFYRKSNYAKFFASHKSLYDETNANLGEVVNSSIKGQWFEDFYGKKLPEINIIASPAYGYNNFSGIDSNGNLNPIIGIANPKGITTEILSTVIHELSHIYSTPVIEPYKEQFHEIGKAIFPHFSKEISRAGYSENELVMESLNEVFTALYLRDVTGQPLENSIYTNTVQRSYIWMRLVLGYMENFEKDRDNYKTIDDFMPQILEVMNMVARNIEPMKINATPYVVSSYPANGSTVEADIKEIRVTFSIPMGTYLTSIGTPEGVSYIYESIDESALTVEEEEEIASWADDYTFVFKLPALLRSGSTYGVTLLKSNTSYDGVPLKDDFILKFTIK